jgi:antitoxin ChpS
MHTTKLRKVGGSVMLAVPPALLDQLQIQSGSAVGLGLDQGRLVVEPLTKPRYTLAELLANSDYSQAVSQEDRDWVSSAAVGNELL